MAVAAVSSPAMAKDGNGSVGASLPAGVAVSAHMPVASQPLTQTGSDIVYVSVPVVQGEYNATSSRNAIAAAALAAKPKIEAPIKATVPPVTPASAGRVKMAPPRIEATPSQPTASQRLAPGRQSRSTSGKLQPMDQLSKPVRVPASPEQTRKAERNVQAQAAAYTSQDQASASAPAYNGDDPHQIRFRADTLVVTPVLNVGLVESARTAAAGETVSFMTYNNYPAFVTRGEVRIFRASQSPDSEPLAVIETDRNGAARWQVPASGASALFYTHRVYGKSGQFDETAPQELTIVDPVVSQARREEVVDRPNFGSIDEASRRNIDLGGMMASVTGRANPQTDRVFVAGQAVPVDVDGRFAAQQIVARRGSASKLDVVIERGGRIIREVEQSFAAPKDDWFVVGQGEVTIGESFGSGPAAEVSGDPTAEGSYAIGRGAFYASGVIGDEDGDDTKDVRITASLDTGEALIEDLFSNLDRKDPNQLLRRLNREQFYPTYGDDSTLVEDAPTQGRFYLRVARDDDQLVVGNFTTSVNGAELAQLDRGLFGILADVNSNATTDFGEKKFQVTAFASDPGTIPGREEFRGTGGSLYFLKRQDISVGSERLRIETRDVTTGLVVESIELHPQQDYDFDPFQGRITLLRPLASIASTGATVREGPNSGNIPVLVVRYEFSPTVGDLDGYTVGGRATGWLGDKVRLGATAQRDTVEDAGQTLIGADAMLRLTAGTYLKAEVAQTDGPGFGQSNSVDGGLTFTDIVNPGAGVKAQAYRTEIAVNLAELQGAAGDRGQFAAYFENYDEGFASAGRLAPSETQRWGVSASVPFTDTSGIEAQYDEITTGTVGDSRTGRVDLTSEFGRVTAKAGVRYEDRTPGVLNNTFQNGSRVDGAVELGYEIAKDINLHTFGQLTLDRDGTRERNNRFGGGVNAQVSERIGIAGEVSGGDGGLGADTQLNYRLGDGSEAYVGYSLFADRTDTGLDTQNIFTRSNRGTLTIGARHRFTDSLSVYGENRTGIGGTAPSLTRSFGLQFEPTEHLSFDGSFERGQIDDLSTGLFRRTAGSVGVGYVNDGVRVGSSIELRKEEGNGIDQTVWLLRNDLSYSVNPDWTFLARFNMAEADNDTASIRAAEFTEAMAGFAFRPVNNERLNVLARFQYFEDLGPAGQFTGSGQVESPKQESVIGSIDVNYDLTKSLTVGAKYGYRSGKVSLGRDSDEFISSDAHLAVIRADYNVHKDWDVLVEGRALWVELSDDVRYGAMGAIYRHLGNNVKVGVGYSLSDFSTDLTDQSFTSHGPFLNLLSKF
ncbi:hypothetical protein INR77_03435 [Erythrobacter sp. SCSIO 43205]|uniref:TonB-dependent receptor n=1 Tax=Erythrobacter sp. SCSIO 43205 TaxID=2779361 RepID=UPI001CA934CF|nr:TonB-dependent receptor [Erythrobacter sp. SCSIO 43205]UAB78788.1 hypothetical protein INR77_03435 [Erythrobacter sp. SCSIO 43205]